MVPASLARRAARLAGSLSRRFGRGGGTTIPGVVLLKLRPRAAAEMAPLLDEGSVVVSATNGKTTTARMLRACLDDGSRTIVANRAGGNLLRGITTALLDADEATPGPRLGVFEVDEAALAEVTDQIAPRVVVLMNLFRDQLDRYGELESLATRWGEIVEGLPPETTLVANVDDPTIAAVAERHENVVAFGIADTGVARAELPHAADSTTCRRCGAALTYDAVLLAHQGHWRCESCGWHRPDPAVAVTSIETDGLAGTDVTIATPAGEIRTTLALPGVHNVYNAAAAAAAATVLGQSPDTVGAALGATDAAFGRAERITVAERELVLLLAKNPTGANENVRILLHDPNPLHVLVQLNDRTADGQDVSWIWDVDYEPLFERLATLTVTGDRAHDMALRFRYGGLADDVMTVEPEHRRALERALDAAPVGGTVYALPTYTSMLELREELVRRGATADYWEDDR